MKIRIRDNSVRLRLTRGEVEAVRQKGVVSCSTCFPGGREFGYILESSPDIAEMTACFRNDAISVRLPEVTALAWAGSGNVSIRGEAALDGGTALQILVEKDFTCLNSRDGEDESDMYQNPDAEKAGC